MAGNSRELLIVFVYDTEVFLREEEDPQQAIVFFHPSWVSANRRMALCGQLMGVAQFLVTGFSFPRLISLGSGKFTMRKIGRFILCVGTDRNIPDWILTKRCEILYHTLQFFHANLNSFDNSLVDEIGEKLSSIMEIYLPVLLYPGNIFGNSPTIRLPKSGSSVFLEASQLLEGFQDHREVYGGAIFYQNKVVMSQLSIDITKQISITDPYRIKIPAKWISSTVKIPAGVQLLTVYINDDELNELLLRKVPSGYDQSNLDSRKISSADNAPDETDNVPQAALRTLTLVEEESDLDHSPLKNGPSLTHMPDIVKDTVRTSSEDEKKCSFSEIKVESLVVNSMKNFHCSRFCSDDCLNLISTPAARYYSFKIKQEEHVSLTDDLRVPVRRRRTRIFHNTITDPTNVWFRQNGLPASKALREDHISLYCQDLKPDSEKLTPKPVKRSKTTGKKRPTNIALNLNDESKTQSRKAVDFTLPPIKGFTDVAASGEVPLTPLMSKLSLMQVSEDEMKEALLTPAGSLCALNDESLLEKTNKRIPRANKKSYFCSEFHARAKNMHGHNKHLTKAILFIFGYQNMSIYLLLNSNCEKKSEFVHRLWKSCADGVKNLERHFQQCFEGIPQTQSLNSINDSYGFLHLHSRWDTLQHGGSWTSRQTDVVNTIREHFTNDPSLTDVTVRFEDCVIYGSQIADNQTYYQQHVEYIAGLPTPSDPMGLISLKAKRRLERDHGMLVL